MHQIAGTSRPVALLSQAQNASWQPFFAVSSNPAKSKLTCEFEARLCLHSPCNLKQQTTRCLQGNSKVCRAQLKETSADHTQSANSQCIANLLKAHQVVPRTSAALVPWSRVLSVQVFLLWLAWHSAVLVTVNMSCKLCSCYCIHLSTAGSDAPACGCTLGQSRHSFLIGNTWVKPLHTG